MIRGVRARTTATAAALVAVVLVLAGISLVIGQRHTLTDNVDEVLQRQFATVAGYIDTGSLARPIPGQGDDDSFAQVIDGSGSIIAATTTSPRSLDIGLPAGDGATFRSLHIPHLDGEYRVLTQRHGDLTIRVGTPLDDVNDSVSALTRDLSIAVPATTLLLAGLVWLLVGRILRPVEDVRRQVAEISGSSLDRRVPDPRTRDEIARLVHTMNEMLERLEASSSRQQRFVADASHELRSPLARIRAELEVDMAHPGTADVVATRRLLLEETATLQRLVDDLLLLARIDSSGLPIRHELVDLDDIVMREVERTPASIDTNGVSAAQVGGDPTHLARVVRNLLDNARQHGGSAITVTLGEDRDQAILSVSDDGDGIPPAMHELVFERFARGDASRSASGGAGLGLGIAREIVTAHGGTIDIDPTHRPGPRFVVRLPLSDHRRARDVSGEQLDPTTMSS